MTRPSSSPVSPARILFVLGLGTAFSLLGDATLYAVLPTHTADAGITLGMVGILLGINRATRLISNGVAGWCYDRLPQRRLFLLGLSIGAFSTWCYAVAPGFWILCLGRIFWGTAWSLIWVGGGTIILNITQESERGRWTGFYQTWFFLGIGVGAFVGGLFTDLVGYRATLWIAAGIQAVGAGIVCAALPPIPRTVEAHASSMPRKSFKALLSREFGVTILCQGVNRFCISGVLYATLGLLVKERIASPGMPVGAATLTGLLIAARTVVSMSTAPLAGHVSDRLGSRWRVISAALFIGILAMLLLTVSSPLLIILGVIFSSVITSAIQSLTITLTGDLVAAAHRGKAMSLLHTLGDLGSALGPPWAYALLIYVGLPGIYGGCAGILALGLGLLLIVRKPAPTSLPR
ncbi:MFS transporter [candidate division KSB3 bacterium]|uniref:MFS transporter n=1 Tax=candidate division KSB3 bacterium TaxID=2044937 RepID=A0A9D5JWU7_9BACT|nr:MFS transporter [candidate division KSB3 bacterium]MBD3325600.1 MFS transporter [candidate division KSB3 bacterium]